MLGKGGIRGIKTTEYAIYFPRFLTRGIQNVKTETLLLYFEYNINKLHSKAQYKSGLISV